MDNSENKTVPNVTCNGTRLSPLEQSVCNNCALFFTCRCGDFTKDGGCLHCCDGYGVPHYLETWWTSLNFRIVIEAFKNAWKKWPMVSLGIVLSLILLIGFLAFNRIPMVTDDTETLISNINSKIMWAGLLGITISSLLGCAFFFVVIEGVSYYNTMIFPNDDRYDNSGGDLGNVFTGSEIPTNKSSQTGTNRNTLLEDITY